MTPRACPRGHTRGEARGQPEGAAAGQFEWLFEVGVGATRGPRKGAMGGNPKAKPEGEALRYHLENLSEALRAPLRADLQNLGVETRGCCLSYEADPVPAQGEAVGGQ